MADSKLLADSIAQTILKMIEVENRFSIGDKLPNENYTICSQFTSELKIISEYSQETGKKYTC